MCWIKKIMFTICFTKPQCISCINRFWPANGRKIHALTTFSAGSFSHFSFIFYLFSPPPFILLSSFFSLLSQLHRLLIHFLYTQTNTHQQRSQLLVSIWLALRCSFTSWYTCSSFETLWSFLHLFTQRPKLIYSLFLVHFLSWNFFGNITHTFTEKMN